MIEWNVDPEIFKIGSIAPRYYGLTFVLGFFVAEKFICRFMEKFGFTQKDVSKLFTYCLVGTILGARLGHCLFYEPEFYLSNPLKILKVWEGGLASHGGFIGVMIGVWLFNRRIKKIKYLWFLDLVAPYALISGSYIRIGNLMNSEILGHPSDLPWAVIFSRIDNIPRHPTQVYEAIGYFTVASIGLLLHRKFHNTWPEGRFVGFILVFGMSWRIFTEFFKENQVAFEQGMLLNMGQILSIPMIVLGLLLIFKEQVIGKKSGPNS